MNHKSGIFIAEAIDWYNILKELSKTRMFRLTYIRLEDFSVCFKLNVGSHIIYYKNAMGKNRNTHRTLNEQVNFCLFIYFCMIIQCIS